MADEKKQLRCRNCDWTGTEDQLGRQLGEIHHLIEKIEPGEIVPYGECPECTCLCFAVSDLFPEYAQDNQLLKTLQDIVGNGDLDDKGQCRYCGRQYTGDDAATGRCGFEECLSTLIRDVITKLPVEKPKVKLIVAMHGGTIQSVMQDTDAVDITDVVFTETSQALDDEDDRDEEGELRFAVGSGPLQGEGIYTHFGPVDIAGPETFDPVMTAAVDRIEWHKTKEKN